jgi:flagellar biosynthetic protein FliR
MALDVDIDSMAVAAALTLRFSLVIATLPLLDSFSVPPLWRLAIAGVLAAALTPAVRAAQPVGPLDLGLPEICGEAARSLLVGALLAFAVNLTFTAVRYAGQVAGVQIGFAIVNTFDPQTGAQVSVIARLYYLLAVLLFFAVDAHHVLLVALHRSATELPLFAGIDAGPSLWLVVREYGQVFALGLRIAAPVVTVLLLVSATMGVIVKTVPQLNVLVVGFPIKIAVGLAVLGFSLVFFREVCLSLMANLDTWLGEVILTLR